jgi:hypothetical protein
LSSELSFALLAMGIIFGISGVLLATPLTIALCGVLETFTCRSSSERRMPEAAHSMACRERTAAARNPPTSGAP